MYTSLKKWFKSEGEKQHSDKQNWREFASQKPLTKCSSELCFLGRKKIILQKEELDCKKEWWTKKLLNAWGTLKGFYYKHKQKLAFVIESNGHDFVSCFFVNDIKILDKIPV